MNFVLEGTLKTNFPGTSLANCAAVPLAWLDESPQMKTFFLGGTVQNSLEGEGPWENGEGPEVPGIMY